MANYCFVPENLFFFFKKHFHFKTRKNTPNFLKKAKVRHAQIDGPNCNLNQTSSRNQRNMIFFFKTITKIKKLKRKIFPMEFHRFCMETEDVLPKIRTIN